MEMTAVGRMNIMSTNAKLDATDIQILVTLQKNGRISNSQLSDIIGLSPSPCLARVNRLERDGFIDGYSAQIDLEKLGGILIIFAEITLNDRRPGDFSRFEQELKAVPEVIECCRVSSVCDYILKISVRSVTHYQSVIDKISEGEIGVEKYFTYFVLRSFIVQPDAPVDFVLGDGPSPPI